MARLHTFLFTDIVGSTSKWEKHPQEMAESLAQHNALCLRVFHQSGGEVFKSLGDGFGVAFEDPIEAVRAAVRVQREVSDATWAVPGGIAIRVGVATGPAEAALGDYFGPALNRVARLCGLAHGGQVLVARATWDLARLPAAPELQGRFLGDVTLRGVERPEPVFQAWGEGMREDFPGLEGKRVVSKPPRHNIPQLERRFVGRVAERLEVAQRLTERGQRLVTLRGPGGIGKTTLSKVVGRDALDDFPGGVWFVECESARSRSELLAAIASALSVEVAHGSLEESVERAVFGRRLLLILDCFEHMVGEAAVVSQLLEWSADMRVLVTSRILLQVVHEHEVEVLPLASQRGANDALTLFEEAARQASPGFAVTKANRAQVEKLVLQLDSVPLALILAAGRLRYLSLDELAEETAQSALAVARGPASAFGRHAELSHVVQTTMERLDGEDCLMAAKCAWFEGGFSLADARGVFRSHPDVFGLIARLRDNSVLTGVVRNDSMRYRELDTVREYLRGTLAPDDLRELKEALVGHFSKKSQGIRQAFESGDWASASKALMEDLANYRSATAWAIDKGDDGAVVVLAESLSRGMVESGLTEEFAVLAEGGIQAAKRVEAVHLEVLLYGLRGAVARRNGQTEAAIREWESRAAACERQGDLDAQADSLLDVASLAHDSGLAEKASAALSAFGEIEGRLQNRLVVLSGRALRAKILAESGDSAGALALLTDVAAFLEEAVPDQLALFVYQRYCETLTACGQAGQSLVAARAWLRLALEGRMVHWALMALACLAESYEAEGDLVGAAGAWEAVGAARGKVSQTSFERLYQRWLRFQRAHPAEAGDQHGSALVEMSWEDLAYLSLERQ